MSVHRASLESFNRASHSDALREMQMVPAESLQPDTDEQPVITIRFGLVLAAISAAAIVGHLVWLRAGSPGPAEILTRLMETLNV